MECGQMAFNLDDYTTVQERSNIFWERYKNGAVRTKIISESDTRVIVVCELFRDASDEKPFATGHAKEVISDRGVNRDFALENCETSARGVAFKAANIGTEKNGPSREEMARVVKTQTNYSPPGTRARAVENVLRESFSVENKLDNPVQWAADGVTMPSAPKPPLVCCNAGHALKTGQTKTTNKPYYGYVCQDGIKEHAVWAKQDATGAWYFPKQEGGE
jgi:hypothetical protein